MEHVLQFRLLADRLSCNHLESLVHHLLQQSNGKQILIDCLSNAAPSNLDLFCQISGLNVHQIPDIRNPRPTLSNLESPLLSQCASYLSLSELTIFERIDRKTFGLCSLKKAVITITRVAVALGSITI